MSLFSRKKKLIVSGCSYTDDYATTQNLKPFPLWPELLAEKLDMECINVGKIAFGNKAIYSTLIDQVVSQKMLVWLFQCGQSFNVYHFIWVKVIFQKV